MTDLAIARGRLWNTVGVQRLQRGFLVQLGIIAGLAFLVRAVYVVAFAPPATGPNDTFWYGFVSAAIANCEARPSSFTARYASFSQASRASPSPRSTNVVVEPRAPVSSTGTLA